MLWRDRTQRQHAHVGAAEAVFACLLQEVMQLEIVRKGLTQYQEHIRSRQWQRQQSFERTVLSYGSHSPTVSCPTDLLFLELLLHNLRPTLRRSSSLTMSTFAKLDVLRAVVTCLHAFPLLSGKLWGPERRSCRRRAGDCGRGGRAGTEPGGPAGEPSRCRQHPVWACSGSSCSASSGVRECWLCWDVTREDWERQPGQGCATAVWPANLRADGGAGATGGGGAGG